MEFESGAMRDEIKGLQVRAVGDGWATVFFTFLLEAFAVRINSSMDWFLLSTPTESTIKESTDSPSI